MRETIIEGNLNGRKWIHNYIPKWRPFPQNVTLDKHVLSHRNLDREWRADRKKSTIANFAGSDATENGDGTTRQPSGQQPTGNAMIFPFHQISSGVYLVTSSQGHCSPSSAVNVKHKTVQDRGSLKSTSFSLIRSSVLDYRYQGGEFDKYG